MACALREPVATLLPESVPYKLPVAMLILYVATSLLVWVVFQVVARFLEGKQVVKEIYIPRNKLVNLVVR